VQQSTFVIVTLDEQFVVCARNPTCKDRMVDDILNAFTNRMQSSLSLKGRNDFEKNKKKQKQIPIEV
jgi:hypothetical protein